MILLLLFPLFTYGQKEPSDLRIEFRGEPTNNPRPELILVTPRTIWTLLLKYLEFG
jgi:hypothetical protein